MLIRKCKYLHRTVCLEAFFKSKCCKHTDRKDKQVFTLIVTLWPEISFSLQKKASMAFKRGETLGHF